MGVWIEDMDPDGWLVLEAERYQPCVSLTSNPWAGCPCIGIRIMSGTGAASGGRLPQPQGGLQPKAWGPRGIPPPCPCEDQAKKVAQKAAHVNGLSKCWLFAFNPR